ncbi:MAG: hypothetical protein ACREEX_06140, partial [Caulobacteraceae bacterium]
IDGGPDVGPIIFYEPMPGYYEVWVEDDEVGSVERTRSAAPARIYGGAFSAPKPEFLGTRAWDESTFKTDDIYVAVRRLAKENAARVPKSKLEADLPAADLRS